MENIVGYAVLVFLVVVFTFAVANKWLPSKFCSMKGWHVAPPSEPGNPKPTHGVCPRCGKLITHDPSAGWVAVEEHNGPVRPVRLNGKIPIHSDSSMTLFDAERIMSIYGEAIDKTAKLIQNDLKEHRVTPMERFNIHAPFLQGLSKFQITTAINLRIANEYLYRKERGSPLEEMDQRVENYCGALMRLLLTKTGDEPREQIYPSKFYSYCKEIGFDNPIYWQKIYTKLGLEYTHLSPKKNLIDYGVFELTFQS